VYNSVRGRLGTVSSMLQEFGTMGVAMWSWYYCHQEYWPLGGFQKPAFVHCIREVKIL
jgi:hypothetical protein